MDTKMTTDTKAKKKYSLCAGGGCPPGGPLGKAARGGGRGELFRTKD